MSRGSLLILLSILVIISPFAGLPLSWLAWILPALGSIVLIIGISIYRDKVARTASQRMTSPVME